MKVSDVKTFPVVVDPFAFVPIATSIGETNPVDMKVVPSNVPVSTVKVTLLGNASGMPLHVLLAPMLRQKSLVTVTVASAAVTLEAEIPNKANKSMPEKIAPE
jgi:hypothetical protein